MKAQEWNVTVGSGKDQRKLSVQLESAEGGEYRLRIGSDVTTVRVARSEAGSYSLIDENGRQRSVDIDGTLPDLKLVIDGSDAVSVAVADAQSLQASDSASSAVGEVRAAMPGKVVKVVCKVGDVVKAGQPLLVIEAMKMENELRAMRGGIVKSVLAAAGQRVDQNAPLIILE